MRFSLILSLLISMPCLGQTTKTGEAKTAGPCSPAATGSNNYFKIDCRGISKEQGQELLTVLNRILENQLSPKLIIDKLDEIQSQLNTHGVLIPDNRPDPPFPSPPPDGALNVLVGNNMASLTGDKLTILNITGTDVLWIERTDKGILISGRVFGPDRRIVADLDRNDITVNPNNTFKRKMSEHTISIEDESGRVVLTVDFVNPRTVIVTGIFYKEGYGQLVVEKDAIHFGKGNSMSGNFMTLSSGVAYEFN